jgi:hypothetical protein
MSNILLCFSNRDHLLKDDLKGHGVAASAARAEEIAVAVPFAILKADCVGIVLSIQSYGKRMEVDAIAFFGITLGFLDFTNHAIIHGHTLLSKSEGLFEIKGTRARRVPFHAYFL